MKAHTPGPWEVRELGGVVVIETQGSPRYRIAEVAYSGDELEEQNDANARLIAAAPELLEALRECRELFSAIRSDWEDPRTECRAGMACIDAAIARAEGR